MSFNDNQNQTRGASTHLNEPTDEAQTFKKTEQVIGRPPVTSENINDVYMRSPPQNIDPSMAADRYRQDAKESRRERTPLQEGVLGHEELGRIKKEDVQSRLVNDEE